MSDQSSQEPTMEEILASIRRIISEDDAPAEPAAEEAPAAEPEPLLEPEPEPAMEFAAEGDGEDVLELTDPIEPETELEAEPPLETVGDIDVYSPPASEPELESAPPPSTPTFDRDEAADNLVGETAASAAASAFGSLSSALLMPKDGRTLEDVVRELLRPLLKEWLDQNLPRIVETKVEEEVQRIARGRP
jgi:cell pole-organizing protein PopZ